MSASYRKTTIGRAVSWAYRNSTIGADGSSLPAKQSAPHPYPVTTSRGRYAGIADKPLECKAFTAPELGARGTIQGRSAGQGRAEPTPARQPQAPAGYTPGFQVVPPPRSFVFTYDPVYSFLLFCRSEAEPFALSGLTAHTSCTTTSSCQHPPLTSLQLATLRYTLRYRPFCIHNIVLCVFSSEVAMYIRGRSIAILFLAICAA